METTQDPTLISTVDTPVAPASSEPEPTPAQDSSPDSSAETLKTDTGTEGKAEAKPVVEEPEETRFDKHPRFQELLKAKKTQAEEIATLQAQLNSLSKPPEAAKDFDKELSELDAKLEEGDLSLAEHSKAVRQILREQQDAERQRLMSDLQQQQEAESLQKSFMEEHPYLKEFQETRSDELDEIRSTNRLHDTISAAMALRIKDLEAEIAKAEKQGFTKGQEQTIKNFKAKQNARALSTGARAVPDNDLAELQDTKKRGGAANVIADRLRRIRSGA